jgi:hypothetical protein
MFVCRPFVFVRGDKFWVTRHGFAWHGKDTADVRHEDGKKVEQAGHLAGLQRRPGLSLNSKSAALPQWLRFRILGQQLRLANAAPLLEIQREVRDALRAVQEQESIGLNGDCFFEQDILDWCFDLGATQLMAPGNRPDPVHYDGGASFIHAGVTLAGGRLLKFKTKEGEISFETRPGQIYLGCLCCAEHYVQHSGNTSTVHHPDCFETRLAEDLEEALEENKLCGNIGVVSVLASRNCGFEQSMPQF